MLECQPPYESMGSPLRFDAYAPMLGWMPPYESIGTPLCSNAYPPANLWLPPSEIKEISGGLELGRAPRVLGINHASRNTKEIFKVGIEKGNYPE